MSRDVRAETDLPAPPEEVWEVIMDPHRLGEWVTTHVGLEGEVPDRLERGSSFRQRLNVGGAPFTVSWEVVEAEPPQQVLWRGEGPGGSGAVVEYLLREADGSTRFIYVNRFDLPGGLLGRIASRAVGERIAKRESEKTLENLKRLLA
jgi:uncharacterized protein YndB with AHSA1/START domain